MPYKCGESPLWAASYTHLSQPSDAECDAVQRIKVPPTEGNNMLYYALAFFVVALIAAVFGFTGLAAGAAAIAKILFFVFLAVAALTFIASLVRRSA